MPILVWEKVVVICAFGLSDRRVLSGNMKTGFPLSSGWYENGADGEGLIFPNMTLAVNSLLRVVQSRTQVTIRLPLVLSIVLVAFPCGWQCRNDVVRHPYCVPSPLAILVQPYTLSV